MSPYCRLRHLPSRDLDFAVAVALQLVLHPSPKKFKKGLINIHCAVLGFNPCQWLIMTSHVFAFVKLVIIIHRQQSCVDGSTVIAVLYKDCFHA